MQAQKVGVREFREQLAKYLESSTPVAVTRHGETIGLYVPTKPKRNKADMEAFVKAAERVREMLAAAGVTEDEVMDDFKQARRRKP